MGLFDFFRINLPYGIRKNELGHWASFNREYMPLGSNFTLGRVPLNEKLIYTSYKGLTDKKIESHFKKEAIHYDANGKIETVFFYNDKTNPESNPKYWKEYNDNIKFISQFKIDEKVHSAL